MGYARAPRLRARQRVTALYSANILPEIYIIPWVEKIEETDEFTCFDPKWLRLAVQSQPKMSNNR